MTLTPDDRMVLNYLRRKRSYVDVRTIFTECRTNSPTRRITDLWRAGKIEKRRKPFAPQYVEYRAKEATR